MARESGNGGSLFTVLCNERNDSLKSSKFIIMHQQTNFQHSSAVLSYKEFLFYLIKANIVNLLFASAT